MRKLKGTKTKIEEKIDFQPSTLFQKYLNCKIKKANKSCLTRYPHERPSYKLVQDVSFVKE